MAEEMKIYENAANVTVAEVETYSEVMEQLRAAVEEVAVYALKDAFVSAAGYKIVDLRGAFTSKNGNWGTSTKNLGDVLHYNGPETPAWAFSDPVAWIKMINGLHDDVGRFSPGWYFDGFAYHEMSAGDTVYWVRDFAAKLPHCGNTQWNAGALAMYIPCGGSQRPSDLTLRTAFTRMKDHLEVMNLKRDRLVPHSAVGASDCCGDVLRSEIRKFIGGGSPGGSVPAPSKPADPKPAPSQSGRIVLAEDYAKDRQVFSGSVEGGDRAIKTLSDFGIKAVRSGKV